MNYANRHIFAGRASKHLPILILAACLTILGIGIYQKTRRAIAPPIYDSMAYYTKGAMVWREWSHGRLVNPLNVGPTIRPPGTMLLTSPLGFSPDFRAFFFRSIYFPVVLFVLGFWVLAESQVQRPRQRWANLAGALMLASLPMFYQFERNSALRSPTDWGYMDCFLGALAALAAAFLIVSVRRCSVGLAALGVIAGALALLVKPAGLVLLPVFCFLWVTELLATHWPILAGWRENRVLKRYSIWTASLLVVIFGATAAACFGSEYLSRTNIRLASNSLNIVIDMFKNVSLWTLVTPQVQASFGWHWVCASIVAGLLSLGAIVVRLPRRSARREDFRFLAVLVALCLGVVWWVKFAGPAMIRYLYPFPMIFLVVLLPAILTAADLVLPRWARGALAVLCVAPMAIIIALLFMDAPPIAWQRLLGVNLSTGQFREEVKMGDLLADQARNERRTLKVYVIPMDERPGVVESEGIYRNLLHPEAPTFQIQHPNDWIRAIMVRRREIVQTDFLLFYPVLDANRLQALLAQQVVDNSTTELEVFSAWLTQASAEQGLQTVSEGVLKLVKVIDRAKLDEAFERLMAKHSWRDLFYNENKEPALLTRDALVSAVEKSVLRNCQLLFNVLLIPAVDLDSLLDSRNRLRCHGPVVRAFRPEWDRSANQSSGEPPAHRTVLRRREAASTALASRARVEPAGTTTGSSSPASGATSARAVTSSAWLHEASAARRGGEHSPLRAAATRGNDTVSPGAGESRNVHRRSRSRGCRELAAICQRRVRRVSRMRHSCPRVFAVALRRVRPREAGGLFLQAARDLPLVRGAAHGGDCRFSGG
jgi:hypothetical protein